MPQMNYNQWADRNAAQRNKYVKVTDSNGNVLNVRRDLLQRGGTAAAQAIAEGTILPGTNPNLPKPTAAAQAVPDIYSQQGALRDFQAQQKQMAQEAQAAPGLNVNAASFTPNTNVNAQTGTFDVTKPASQQNTPFWQTDEFKQIVTQFNPTPIAQQPTASGSNTNVLQSIVKPSADPNAISPNALPTAFTYDKFGLTAPNGQPLNPYAVQHIDTTQPRTFSLLPEQGQTTGQPIDLGKPNPNDISKMDFGQIMNYAYSSPKNFLDANVQVAQKAIGLVVGGAANWLRGQITSQTPTNVLGNAAQVAFNSILAMGNYTKNFFTGIAAGVYSNHLEALSYQAARQGNIQLAGQYHEAAQQVWVNQVDEARSSAQLAEQAVSNSWNRGWQAGTEYDKLLMQADAKFPGAVSNPSVMAQRNAYLQQLVDQTTLQYRQQAVANENLAFQLNNQGNYQGAMAAMTASLQDKLQSDPMGSLGAYTWIRQQDRQDAFIKNVAYLQLQKGAPLTDEEITVVRDHFANSWTELTGQSIFDPAWLVPQKVWDMAFEPIKLGLGAAWKGVQQLPVIGDLTNFLSRQGFGSMGAYVNKYFADFLSRFSKSYESTDEVAKGLGDLAQFINDVNTKNLGPNEAEQMFQEAKKTIPGLNQFGTYSDVKKIVDFAADPRMAESFNVFTWQQAFSDSVIKAEAESGNFARSEAIKELGAAPTRTSVLGTLPPNATEDEISKAFSQALSVYQEKLDARTAEILKEYANSTKYMVDPATDFAGKATGHFLDPRRIYNGSYLLEDTITGQIVRNLREFAGKEVNDRIWANPEEMGKFTIGRWMAEHGIHLGNTTDDLLKAIGEMSGPNSWWRRGAGSLATGIENIMRVGNIAREAWVTAVLSLNPSWVIRNYIDSSFRHVVYGGSLWDDVRAMSFSMQRELEGNTGLQLHELSQALARDIETRSQVPTRFAFGWKPAEGPFAIFSYFKFEFDRLGAERAAAIGDSFFSNSISDRGLRNSIVDMFRSIPGTMSDINNAMEYTLRLRMFHDEYFKALEILNPKVLDQVIGSASPELQSTMRMIWDAADGNPQKIQSLTASFLNEAEKGGPGAWSLLVPDSLKEALPHMSLQDQTLLIRPVRDSLQEMITNIKQSGRDVTKEDFNMFFKDVKTRLQDEIQAHAAQIYDEKGISMTLNTGGQVSQIPTEFKGPMPEAAPEKAGIKLNAQEIQSQKDAAEAAQKIKATTIPFQMGKTDKLMQNFKGAIAPIAEFREGASGIKVFMEGGQPVIAVGNEMLSYKSKDLYPMLRDATIKAMGLKDQEFLAKAGINNSEQYVSMMQRFLQDPAKFAESDSRNFLSLVEQLQSNPYYSDLVSRLNGKYVNYDSVAHVMYGQWGGLTNYSNGQLEELRQFTKSVDADIPIPSEYRIVYGLERPESTRKIVSLVQDESLPLEVRQNLMTLLDYRSSSTYSLNQFAFKHYPGPDMFTGAMRKNAWNQYYRWLSGAGREQNAMLNEVADAFVRNPQEGMDVLDRMLGIARDTGKSAPDVRAFMDEFLRRSGMEVTWDAEHNMIMNTKVTNMAGRSQLFEGDIMKNLIFDNFYSDNAMRTLDLNKPIHVDINGKVPVMEQVTNAIAHTFELPRSEAKAWATMFQKRAENFAADTGRPIEEYFSSHGFQRVGTSGAIEGENLMNFMKAFVGKTEDGTTMLYGLASPDRQSLINSTAGMFYQDLRDAATKGSSSSMESLKRINAYIESVTGQKVKETLTSEQAKVMADQFNLYLAKGELPNVDLYKPFNEMKSWLSDAYTSLKDTELDKKLSPDVKTALDTMLQDVNASVPKTNARQIQIMAGDLGLPTNQSLQTMIYNHYNPAGAERLRIQDEVFTALGRNQQQSDATMRIADSMAQYWSRQTGRPAAEWYGERLAGLQHSRLQDLVGKDFLRQTGEGQKNWIAALAAKLEEKATPEDANAFKALQVQSDGLINDIISRYDKTGITEQDIKEFLNNQLQTNSILNKYGLSIKEESPADRFFNRIFGDPTTPELITQDIAINRYRQEQALAGNIMSYKDAKASMLQNTPNANIDSMDALLKRAETGPLPFMDRMKAEIQLGKLDLERFINDTPILNYLRSNPILFQEAKGGMEIMPDGRALIHMFQGGDVSTVVHELAHVWRRDLSPEDLKIVSKAMGVPEGAEWARSHEEQFARSFERYLAGGKAPSDELKPLFQKFRDWLLGIYDAIKGSSIDVKISPELRNVFDNLMTSYVPQKYGRLGDVPIEDATKALQYYSKNPAPVQMNDEINQAWQALLKGDPIIDSFPEAAKTSPDTMKAYLNNRILNEHPETASMYRDQLWRVEQFQDAMLNLHKGQAFQEVLYPAINAGKMDDGIRTWVGHRNYLLSNYDQALQAMDAWNKYLNDAVDNGGTIYQKFTSAQADEMRQWATNAAKAKGQMVSTIVNGGNMAGMNMPGAVDKVNHVMLNYQYSTQLDQLMRNWFPFWKFPSRSWPLWAEALMTHPEIVGMYNKLMEASRSQLYQANVTTTSGAARPSMLGYFNVPGTDMWYNPMAPFSAKYVLDAAGLANTRYSNVDPNAGVMDSLTQQFEEASRVYGFSTAPWVIWTLKAMGKLPDNVVPPTPAIPQVNFIPKWWINDVIRMGRQTNLPDIGNNILNEAWQGTMQGANNAIQAIYPDTTGNDYSVENRILSDTLAQIRNSDIPDAKKLEMVSQAQQAISEKGTNALWLSTYKEVSQDSQSNAIFSYFTGFYPKQYSTDMTLLNKLRDQNTMLRSAMNNEMQSQIFNLPSDPASKWNFYKNYQSTPEGWINRLRSDISWVTDPLGNVVDNPQQRATLLAQKIQEESVAQSHYDALARLTNEYNQRLSSLPVGAPYNMKSPVYAWYAEQKALIDQMYPLTYEAKYGTYKPVELIMQQLTQQWYYYVKSTMPIFDPGKETYAQYQQRIQQWYGDMPSFAKDLMYGKSENGGFINSPSVTNITGSLHPDQVLGANFWTNLLNQTNFTGYNSWDMQNDNIFNALNKAYDALYYQPYWAAVTAPDGTFLKGEDYNMAVYNWADAHNGGTPPTPEELNAWIQQTYPGQFNQQDVLKWANSPMGALGLNEEQQLAHSGQFNLATTPDTNGIYGITPANATQGQIYQMQQDIWNLLSWGGPGKGDAALTFALQDPTAPPHEGNIQTWRDSQGTVYSTDYQKLKSFHDALVWAAQSLNLQPPSRDQTLEYLQAQQHNDQFQQYVMQKINQQFPLTSFTITDPLTGHVITVDNTTAYDLLQGKSRPPQYDSQGNLTDPGVKSLWEMAYGDGSLSASEKKAVTRNFLLANADLYKIIQYYYHWYDVQTASDPLWASYYGPTAMSSHRAYKPHTRRSKMSILYTMPTVDTGQRPDVGINFPTGFQSTVGDSLTNEIIDSQKNGSGLSSAAIKYLTGLSMRHPEWASFIHTLTSYGSP